MGKKDVYQMWGQMYSVSAAGRYESWARTGSRSPVDAQPTKSQIPAGLPDTRGPRASRALNV